jgi:hypothetical protein
MRAAFHADGRPDRQFGARYRRAVEHVTTLARWSLTLRDGSRIVIWADGYSEADDDLVFGALVDAPPEEQAALDVISRTPSNPARVVVALACFPRSAVETIRST